MMELVIALGAAAAIIPALILVTWLAIKILSWIDP